jgi:hypothetical protein
MVGCLGLELDLLSNVNGRRVCRRQSGCHGEEGRQDRERQGLVTHDEGGFESMKDLQHSWRSRGKERAVIRKDDARRESGLSTRNASLQSLYMLTLGAQCSLPPPGKRFSNIPSIEIRNFP